MTQENKQLLFVDLSSRLPYGVKCFHPYGVGELDSIDVEDYGIDVTFKTPDDNYYSIEECKPYLRSLKSMTEEEQKELYCIDGVISVDFEFQPYQMVHLLKSHNVIDWLNKKMFDYRTDDEGKTLIEKGIALEAPEGMYDKI